jgi:hypothetical protein
MLRRTSVVASISRCLLCGLHLLTRSVLAVALWFCSWTHRLFIDFVRVFYCGLPVCSLQLSARIVCLFVILPYGSSACARYVCRTSGCGLGNVAILVAPCNLAVLLAPAPRTLAPRPICSTRRTWSAPCSFIRWCCVRMVMFVWLDSYWVLLDVFVDFWFVYFRVDVKLIEGFLWPILLYFVVCLKLCSEIVICFSYVRSWNLPLAGLLLVLVWRAGGGIYIAHAFYRI